MIAWVFVFLGVIDATQAGAAFAELERLCSKDAGAMWGVSLCGPVMLVEPETRVMVLNTEPHTLKPGIFVGALPKDVLIANTSVTWEGTHWAQLIWPLPDEARDVLLVHESFHRIEPELRMQGVSNEANAHLSTERARVLLQLEWRALTAALRSNGEERKHAITDALVFRGARRQLAKMAAAEENSLECYEGLAEYTGVAMAGADPSARRAFALEKLTSTAQRPSFVRSFAYASGPAYGLLLDESGDKGWRKEILKSGDLGALLARASGVKPAGSAAERAKMYDGDAIAATERERALVAEKQADAYRSQLVTGPVLRLPLSHMRIQFNPSTLVPLGTSGTVYPTAQIMDDWGTLTVTGGVLVSSDRKHAFVAAPSEAAARAGAGWSLLLQIGWRIVKGERPKDFKASLR